MSESSEITAATKILDIDHEEEYRQTWHAPLLYKPPSSRDVAKRILDAAERVRPGLERFVAVGRIKLPNGEWHNFALGPFTTLLRAQRAGEGFTHDPKTGTGTGDYRAMPLLKKPADAWEKIRPEQADHKQWIRDQIATNMTGLSDPNVYKEKE